MINPELIKFHRRLCPPPPTPWEVAKIVAGCMGLIYVIGLAALWCMKHQDYVDAFVRIITFGMSE